MSSARPAGDTTKTTVRPRRVIDTGSRCAASISSPNRYRQAKFSTVGNW
jgi:hypothetical protein